MSRRSAAFANGTVYKCLTVVDEFTRERLAVDVASSVRSDRVIHVLSHLMSMHGAPRYSRADNGPEFVTEPRGRNGLNESFNGKLRDESDPALHVIRGPNFPGRSSASGSS